MKKISSILLVTILVTVLVLSGCATDVEKTSLTDTDVSEDTASVNEDNNQSETETTDEATDTTEDTVEEVTYEPVSLRVIAPYGTPTLSMVQMMVEEPVIMDHITVSYEAIQAPDVLSTELINKGADIAIVPTNLAATLYSKDLGYKIAGISVWGNFYIAATEEVNTLADLKGKTLGVFGRNLTPDAVMRYVLSENGINPDEDLTMEYFTSSSELATNYIAGNNSVAMIPQPLLTNVQMKKEDSVVAIDLAAEWKALTGHDNYPQACIIVSEALVTEHPEAVEAFFEAYAEAVNWVNSNPLEAGTYYESLEIGLNAKIVETAIPGCYLEFVPSAEAVDSLNTYLTVLYDFNPQLTGGEPVDEGLYLKK